MFTKCMACSKVYLQYSSQCPKCAVQNYNKKEPLGLIIVGSIIAIGVIVYYFVF